MPHCARPWASRQTAPTSANTRADLASFLERLSDELAADAPSVLPTGSVLNLTA